MNHADIARIDALAEGLVAEHRLLLRSLVNQRKSHQLTQREVAERMGVSQPVVSAFERYDANPSLATIRRYALAVGAGIEHKVTDECCETENAFEGMVRGITMHWQEPTQLPTWGESIVLEATGV